MGLVLHVNCEGEPFHREAILLSKIAVRICGALRAEFLEKIALERVSSQTERSTDMFEEKRGIFTSPYNNVKNPPASFAL